MLWKCHLEQAIELIYLFYDILQLVMLETFTLFLFFLSAHLDNALTAVNLREAEYNIF